MFGCNNADDMEYVSPFIYGHIFSFSCDMALDPVYGLRAIEIPFSSENEPVYVKGEGLEDVDIITGSQVLCYSWGMYNKPNIIIGSFLIKIVPKENFNKNIPVRRITELIMTYGESFPVDIRLHTMTDSEVSNQGRRQQLGQGVYFNGQGETKMDLYIPIEDLWFLSCDVQELYIKKIEFLYGNLKFGDCVELYFDNHYYFTRRILDPSNADCMLTDESRFDLLADIKAVDNSKEVVADTLIVEYAFMDNPDVVYRVFSNSVVFLNVESE